MIAIKLMTNNFNFTFRFENGKKNSPLFQCLRYARICRKIKLIAFTQGLTYKCRGPVQNSFYCTPMYLIKLMHKHTTQNNIIRFNVQILHLRKMSLYS